MLHWHIANLSSDKLTVNLNQENWIEHILIQIDVAYAKVKFKTKCLWKWKKQYGCRLSFLYWEHKYKADLYKITKIV